jgi:hypothetical protein
MRRCGLGDSRFVTFLELRYALFNLRNLLLHLPEVPCGMVSREQAGFRKYLVPENGQDPQHHRQDHKAGSTLSRPRWWLGGLGENFAVKVYACHFFCSLLGKCNAIGINEP